MLSVLGVVVHLGIDSVINRYVAEMQAKREYFQSLALILKALKFRLISVLFSISVLILFKTTIASYFDLPHLYIYLLSALLFTTKLNTFFGTSFHLAVFRIKTEKTIQIFYDIIKLLGFIYCSQNDNLKYVLLFWILAEIVILGLFLKSFLTFYKKELYSNFKTKLNAQYKRRILNYSKSQTFAVLLFFMVDVAVDNLMISYYYDAESVAIYSFSMGLLAYLSFANPSFILKNYLTSFLTKKFQELIHQEIAQEIRFIFKCCIIIALPIFTVSALNINHILPILYGQKFIEASQLILYGLFFYFFKDITFTFSPLINVFEQNILFLKAGIFSIFNFFLNLFLIPSFGIYGALIGTGLTWILIFIFYLYGFYKYFNSIRFFPLRILILGSLIVLLFYFFESLIFVNVIDNIYILLFKVFAEIILIFSSFFAFRIIKKNDIQNLLKILNT